MLCAWSPVLPGPDGRAKRVLNVHLDGARGLMALVRAPRRLLCRTSIALPFVRRSRTVFAGVGVEALQADSRLEMPFCSWTGELVTGSTLGARSVSHVGISTTVSSPPIRSALRVGGMHPGRTPRTKDGRPAVATTAHLAAAPSERPQPCSPVARSRSKSRSRRSNIEGKRLRGQKRRTITNVWAARCHVPMVWLLVWRRRR
jgi:hypothetical protein